MSSLGRAGTRARRASQPASGTRRRARSGRAHHPGGCPRPRRRTAASNSHVTLHLGELDVGHESDLRAEGRRSAHRSAARPTRSRAARRRMSCTCATPSAVITHHHDEQDDQELPMRNSSSPAFFRSLFRVRQCAASSPFSSASSSASAQAPPAYSSGHSSLRRSVRDPRPRGSHRLESMIHSAGPGPFRSFALSPTSVPDPCCQGGNRIKRNLRMRGVLRCRVIIRQLHSSATGVAEMAEPFASQALQRHQLLSSARVINPSSNARLTSSLFVRAARPTLAYFTRTRAIYVSTVFAVM
jgi:hypothetical protein